MLEKKMKAYYRQAMYGEKNSLARTADLIAFSLVGALAGFIWFSGSLKSPGAGLFYAVLVGLAVGLGIGLYRNIRLDRFVQKKRISLVREYMFEQMVLMPTERFNGVVRDLVGAMGYRRQAGCTGGFLARHHDGQTLVHTLQNHPDHPLSAQQTLECYRLAREINVQSILIVCTAAVSDAAREFMAKLQDMQIQIISRERLMDLAHKQGLLPPVAQAERALIREMERKRAGGRNLRGEAFSGTRVKAYLACAAILFIAGRVTGHSFYYPAIGIGCLLLAAWTAFINRHKNKGTAV